MASPVAASSRFAARIVVTALTLGLSLSAGASPSLKAMQAGSTHLQLGSTPYDLSLGASKSASNARAASMASADFNTDGYADLVSGYAQDQGGFIALHRGNPEAYAPTSPSAFANLKRGIYPPGFVSEAQIWDLPVVPELLVVGDFNADGDSDVVFAQRSDDAIYFMPGSRAGFGAAQKIAVGGTVDAIAAGEIDLPNAAPDLVVAISARSGVSLKIFRDGIANSPTSQDLPAVVSQLAIGNVDDSMMGDVVILAGGKISILHGYDPREGVPNFSRLEGLDVGAAVQSFALGNFIWDRQGKTELALLQADGTLVIAARGALNTAPFSLAEVRAQRRAQLAAKSSAMKSWQPGIGGAWEVRERTADVVSKVLTMHGAVMLRANLAGQAADDLLVVDALSQTLKVLTVEGSQRKTYSVATSSAPVTALTMPTSNFVLPSLIVLAKGATAPSILPSSPNAIFTVSKTTDTNDGICNADCSLREAISAANLSAGADSIVLPAGTYQLTIANTGGLNEDDNNQGDLDVNDALSINGGGSATTIVRAGSTTSNGIDKVFAFNPYCASPMATGISGITVSFGRNTQPTTAWDFSYGGGAMDWCGTSNSSMTVTNSVFDSNTNTFGYGGAINLDSVFGNGSVVITGSTLSNNRTLAAGGLSTGGALNLFADAHSVTITNSSITGNASAGEGGGVVVRHTNGGAILIQGSTISNNTAASRGGGVSSFNFGVATFTINQDSVVSGNTSQGLAALAAEGGGIYSNSAATTTINEVTITGNSATGAGVSEQRGGGGIATGGGTVNVTFSRIVGNTALGLGGSGIHKDLNAGTTTATNNWWGCNAGAASAPCDRAVLDAGSGSLVSTPHLALSYAASPNSIVVGQTSTLTADFLTNSASSAIAVANLDAMIGTAHAHNNPVRGTLSAAQAAIQSAGTATATFTATAVGAGSADSVVDSQTRTAAITIGKANTTTTITSDTPDPSLTGGVVAVNYTVAVAAPGSGTPTGNVVITISGGAETCTGTVAAGSCNITLTAAGSRILTATYAGDANYNGSTDTDPHVVANPTNVSIAVAPASVNEDAATNLVYTITRDTNLVTATVVNISTSGTATAGTDYTGNVATVTIPANGTTATITIIPTTDSTTEADETVILTVAAGAGYSVGAPASATGTILNDDLPSVSIAVAPASVTEDGAQNLVYTVTMDQVALSATSVNFTVGGSATAGTDYAAVTSPLVIPVGNLTGSVSVNPNADASIEADETVTLTLAAGSGYTIGVPAAATGTILNDDLPALAINDVTLAEGNAGTTNATFTISLNAPAGPGGVTFDIATANDTATAGSDYVAQGPTAMTIPAGSSSATFAVLINGDTLNEPNETFFVNVANVVNATVTDAQGLGTISNDDPLPTLAIDNVTVIEGNAGTVTATFTVTLNTASGQSVSVNYATADGTATSGSDYVATSGMLTFTPGQTTQSIGVTVNGDIVPEGNETFGVTLSGAANATIATATGTGTISNDDVPVTVSPGSLPAATVALPYAQTISASGGVGAYSFAVTAGALPAGITLTTGGVLSGTSTAGGTFNFTITATDSSPVPGPFSGSQAYTLIVNPASVVLPATILPSGVTAVPYASSLTSATGGTAPYSYTVTAGALPGGIAMSLAGVFSGTPIAGGTFNFTVTATDSSSGSGPYSAMRAYSIAVTAITLSPLTLPNGTAGVAYTQTLTASGGSAPYTYSVSAGALPAGMVISTTGLLSGTPTASGTFSFTVSAIDTASAVGTQAYTLSVAAPTLTLAPTSLISGTAGTAYTQAITASGGIAPYSYTVSAGALPAGLTLGTGGTLSGTPTVAGSFNFTVTATDSTSGTAGSGLRAYTLVLAAPTISLASANVPPPLLGVAYSATLIATGGTAPYTYAVTAGALPAGLSLSPSGVLSGTPTAVGPAMFTITATDALGFSGERTFNFTVLLFATPVPVDSPLALGMLALGMWLAGLALVRRRVRG